MTRKILLPLVALSATIAGASISTPSVADSGVSTQIARPSWVANIAGDKVRVKFVGGQGYRWLVQRGSADERREWTTNGTGPATINFRSKHDDRCVKWRGPGRSDGKWKLQGDKWIGMSFVSTSVKVYPMSDCAGVTRWL